MIQYYRARYYDPSNGRFLSEDSARFFGGTNSFAYVKNDPPDLDDPFGFAGKHPRSLDLAWNKARLLLSNGDCAKFLKTLLIALHLKPDLNLLLQNFDNTNFGFTPKHDPFEQQHGAFDIAHVDWISMSPSNNVVHIFPGAVGAQNSDLLAVTMMHEILHTYPYALSDFEIAAAVGYSGSPANGVKPASHYFSNEMEKHCMPRACNHK